MKRIALVMADFFLNGFSSAHSVPYFAHFHESVSDSFMKSWISYLILLRLIAFRDPGIGGVDEFFGGVFIGDDAFNGRVKQVDEILAR